MDQERLEGMRGVFTGPLLTLKDTLLMMASLTDRNFTMALQALMERNEEKAKIVEAEDADIDKLEIDVDDMVVTYVSTHGPVATSARLALSASKMSEALENIADQATSISRLTRKLCAMPEVDANIDLLKMGKIALDMMRETISAFVDVDPDKAFAIVQRDKEVDALNKACEEELNKVMATNSELIPACVSLLLVARSIERAGDYAKNIAHDVYFLYTAQDIRHDNLTNHPR